MRDDSRLWLIQTPCAAAKEDYQTLLALLERGPPAGTAVFRGILAAIKASVYFRSPFMGALKLRGRKTDEDAFRVV